MHDNGQADHCDPISVFEDVVPRSLLECMNATIDVARRQWWPRDGRRASMTARTFAGLLRGSDSFNAVEAQACSVARRWAAATFGREFAGEPLYILRCADRRTPAQSYLRHFDSHILTLLIPLQLAEAGERSGDLIVYRLQRRPVSVIANVPTKARLFIEHGLPLLTRRALVERDRSSGLCVRIACTPGNVYVFNGFLTMHTNLDVESGARRSLIIHYYDPGLTAGLRLITQTVRAFRDRLADLS